MEAFSLLKYWKSAGAAAGETAASIPVGANTILAAVTDDDDDGDGEGEDPDVAATADDGPFFDLEFTGPVDGDETPEGGVLCVEASNCVDGGGAVEVVEDESETDDVVKFRISSSGSGSERTDPKFFVSPLEDLFFQGQNLPEQNGSDYSDPNSAKPQLMPVSLLRSATRLRFLMSRFKKSSRSDPSQTQIESDPNPSQEPQQGKRQLFTIKFKLEDVPIISHFNRDHRSRASNGAVSSASSSTSSSTSSSSKQPPSENLHSDSNEKQNPKDGIQKYFKMVKPLYIRVSKRYSIDAASPTPAKSTEKTPVTKTAERTSTQKMQGSLAVGLRVMMRKRLGKSNSAVAGVVHPAAPVAGSQQRDDPFIQQQEWIQGAIMHCKRSFNASREDEESSSVSNPSHEMTVGEMILNA